MFFVRHSFGSIFLHLLFESPRFQNSTSVFFIIIIISNSSESGILCPLISRTFRSHSHSNEWMALKWKFIFNSKQMIDKELISCQWIPVLQEQQQQPSSFSLSFSSFQQQNSHKSLIEYLFNGKYGTIISLSLTHSLAHAYLYLIMAPRSMTYISVFFFRHYCNEIKLQVLSFYFVSFSVWSLFRHDLSKVEFFCYAYLILCNSIRILCKRKDTHNDYNKQKNAIPTTYNHTEVEKKRWIDAMLI